MDQVVIYDDDDIDWNTQTQSPRDLILQLTISAVVGLAAFLTFCFLRTRWTGLYAARKRQSSAASRLPDLPESFFGWIPVLYRITDQEVLYAAGLDAFVFLSFFRLAIKFLTITFLFSLVIVLPVHHWFAGDWAPFPGDGNDNQTEIFSQWPAEISTQTAQFKDGTKPPSNYMWMYVIFTYFFTALAMYLMILETNNVIEVRQKYLGSQTTITDRTLRLSGIPANLQSESKIKEFLEQLEIGKVESVMLCRNWKKLDDLMEERMNILKKLEEVWTVHLGFRRVERDISSLPIVQPSPPGPTGDTDAEDGPLLSAMGHVTPYRRTRPKIRIRRGFLDFRGVSTDAIDHYTKKLQRLDSQLELMRRMKYKPTPLAFVTMDSVAACQMAMQAILDPTPMQLLTKPAPAPVDVIWKNTYLPRKSRMARAWSITLFIIFLTIFWSAILAPIAGLLQLKTIHKWFPSLAEAIQSHPVITSLVSTGLPTLAISLLSTAVPYMYYWLSAKQGMTSRSDVELSVISKNFFFGFFNLFIVFTAFGTASNFYGFVGNLRELLKDTTKLAFTLAEALGRLAPFYTNLIVLQGIALFPFKLLEFGTVFMYPFNLIGSKTPRDYAELVQPPEFSYGLYLPQTILVFVICTVYSLFEYSWRLLGFGLLYFVIGHFVHKYQLLYAMDHRQHSTGRAWPMICARVFVGIIVFQLSMSGFLALKLAIKRSILILPLIAFTLWFSYTFSRSFEPLTKFIALRSIERPDGEHDLPTPPGTRYSLWAGQRRTVEESQEMGMKFVNPSLVDPLEKPWVSANGSLDSHDEETV
ncbi:MAG: hypothetical protein M1834_006473 [Cirrosporium novae-zelandiae]|nr:MAG: hypothetical protein M1834_006473 [Cirrosporium novae-zelandiae]